MGKQQHIDNDIVKNVSDNIDNDIVRDTGSYARIMVSKSISEEKLVRLQEFLFNNKRPFGECGEFIKGSIKQIERFVYIWYTDLDDATRKVILDMHLEYNGDNRERSYKDYTESPLWKYTSSVIKIAGGFTCKKCDKSYDPTHLVVHHKTYEHLGSELKYLGDVELICVDCHLKTHNIKKED